MGEKRRFLSSRSRPYLYYDVSVVARVTGKKHNFKLF